MEPELNRLLDELQAQIDYAGGAGYVYTTFNGLKEYLMSTKQGAKTMAERSQSIDYLKRTMREKAYLAIDSERDYQDTKYGPLEGQFDGRYLKISDWEVILTEQMDALEHEVDAVLALHIIRKIAAICVACMEQHGAPVRE